MQLTATLIAHPSTPSPVVRRLSVEIRLAKAGSFVFRYALEADMGQICVPARSSTATRADFLWQRTCFEAFVQEEYASGYLEFNFSPSREWALYRFTGYRSGMSLPEIETAPHILVHEEDGRLELTSTVNAHQIPEMQHAHQLRFSPAVVIEDASGELSYWALSHPLERPDFHVPAELGASFGICLSI